MDSKELLIKGFVNGFNFKIENHDGTLIPNTQIVDENGNYLNSFRAYCVRQNAVGLQIRTYAPLVKRGKPHSMMAHITLSREQAKELADTINAIIAE